MSTHLDTAHWIETPEGVDLSLPVAGPVVRALAWLIDQAIRVGFYIAAATVLTPMGGFGQGSLSIAIFGAEWFYPVLFEVLRHGATPGKKAMGLAVVRVDGNPVGWGDSIARNLIRFADFLPFFYGFGLISMLTTRSFQRLGDLAAGTLVVYRREHHCPLPVELTAEVGEAEEAGPDRDLSPIPPLQPLELEEQRAVIDFADRAPRLSEARSAELAELAAPTLPRGKDAWRTLVQIAAWLQGRRNGPAQQGGHTT